VSRKRILDTLRRAGRRPVEPPPSSSGDGQWVTYADKPARFAEALATAAGRCVETDARSTGAELERLVAASGARKIFSAVPELGSTVAPQDDPHAYAELDLAVVRGAFGVAENGAVWVTDEGLPASSVCFLPTHLALVVTRANVVDNMHAAYERLAFTGRGFGTFIAGPSKTADIEQALVVGAHGPRSLTVLLVGS